MMRISLACLLIFSISPAHAFTKNCGDPPDLLIVLDHSLSMSLKVGMESKWALATAAINNVLGTLEGQVRPGLMLFPKHPGGSSCDGGQVNVVPGTNTKNAIAGTLSSAFPDGLTPMGVSLKNAFDFLKGFRPGKPKYVVLIADGKETCQGKPVDWVNALMNAGIKTFIVGFGSGVNQQELNSLANAGGTAIPGPVNYYQADNPFQLKQALDKIGSMVSCCGNGVLDPGELCDKTIPPGVNGACPQGPAQCNDNNPCTHDFPTGMNCGVTCNHSPVTAPKHGDGCCPPGANSVNDNDCKQSCGNGVLEPGEKCDPKIQAGPGKCVTPAMCDDHNPCSKDQLAGSACDVHCIHKPVQPNLNQKDGCCPKGYSSLDDRDCPDACGPDKTENCVNLCAGVNCPDGSYCRNGKCVPWPNAPQPDPGGGPQDAPGPPPGPGQFEQGGCTVSPGPATAPPLCLLLGVALFLIVRRRR
jgi:hypothetical protein